MKILKNKNYVGHRTLFTEDKDIETRPLKTIQMIKAFGGYQKQEGVFSVRHMNYGGHINNDR